MSTTTIAPDQDANNPDRDSVDISPTPDATTHAIESTAEELAPLPAQTTEIVRYNGGSTELIHGASAADRVAVARDIATALNDVIVSQGLRTKVGSRKKLDPHTGDAVRDGNGREVWEPKWHVDVEGWQTLATLLGCAIIPHDPKPAIDPATGRAILRHFDVHEKTYHKKADGGGLKSERSWTVDGHDWTVKTDIVKDGVLIASATGSCSRTEPKWIDSAEYAVQGMAATRSMSRAIATAARWIVALAGYSTTPSEEMPAGAAQEPPAAAPAAVQRLGDGDVAQVVEALLHVTGARKDRDGDIIRELYRALGGGQGERPTVEIGTAVLRIADALLRITDRDGSEPQTAPQPPVPPIEDEVPLSAPAAASTAAEAGRRDAAARAATEQQQLDGTRPHNPARGPSSAILGDGDVS